MLYSPEPGNHTTPAFEGQFRSYSLIALLGPLIVSLGRSLANSFGTSVRSLTTTKLQNAKDAIRYMGRRIRTLSLKSSGPGISRFV